MIMHWAEFNMMQWSKSNVLYGGSLEGWRYWDFEEGAGREVHVPKMPIGTMQCITTLPCFQQELTREGLIVLMVG
jgi:hypothetical protein